ncbi:MAG TPA: hypothetical protein VGB17_17915 [Pyrinomonadaceae bacterium]|jgi:hypothetical protein
MKSQKKSVLLLVTLALTVVVSSAALQEQTQKNSMPSSQEEATPVQEGVMTEKQRVHANLFKKQYEYRKAKKLSSLTGNDTVGVEIGIPNIPSSPSPPTFSLYEFLKSLSCQADAIVVGAVKSKSAQLTEDETFIFTDYEVRVEEIIKNNVAAAIQVKGELTLARPGGVVSLNGRTIYALDRSFKPLELGGRYLLFLQFIPSTGAYKQLNSKGSYQIKEGNKRIKLTNEPLPSELENGDDVDSFLNELRHANNSCHN